MTRRVGNDDLPDPVLRVGAPAIPVIGDSRCSFPCGHPDARDRALPTHEDDGLPCGRPRSANSGESRIDLDTSRILSTTSWCIRGDEHRDAPKAAARLDRGPCSSQ